MTKKPIVLPSQKIIGQSLITRQGFTIQFIGSGIHTVRYPHPVWKNLPMHVKQFIAENAAYADIRPVTLLSRTSIDFQITKPFFRQFTDWGIKKDLPRLSALNDISPATLRKNFSSPKISFEQNAETQNTLVPSFSKTRANTVVFALSFGKDSLLSWGVARELGLDCIGVLAHEMDATSKTVRAFKNKIAKNFSKKEREVLVFYDNDELFTTKEEEALEEVGNTNGMFTFALEFLPFVIANKARYFVVGNERNMNDYFMTRWGEKAYPSPDQSMLYTVKQNRLWQKITGGKFSVVSFIEPLFNIAEMRILYNRYPHLLKYMMSCPVPNGSQERWCYNCPMCAKAFLYSVAVGGDPKKIAFNEDFFQAKYAPFYPIFNPTIHRHYERPKAVRDEQLLAFLMAERRGSTGALIKLFAHSARNEALTREREFRKRYLGVHPARTIPAHLVEKVTHIYREELRGF